MMLVGSILIGAIAGFALLNYVNGVEEGIENEQARVEVWVVAQDVAAGTTAADVRNTNRLELRSVETQFRPANAVTDLSQIEGRIAVNNLAANQILVTGLFDDPETVETTFADLIEPNEIAFTVPINTLDAVGGLVEPGDFVDVIVVQPLGETLIEPELVNVFDEVSQDTVYDNSVRFLYRGVRVIGVNDDFVGQPAPDPTLEAAPEEAGGTLEITLALPTGSTQKILAVDPNKIKLALHPDDWDPSNEEVGAVGNEIPALVVSGDLLPGEDPNQLTPYGRQGFQDPLAEDAPAPADLGDAGGDTGLFGGETDDLVDDVADDAGADNEEG